MNTCDNRQTPTDRVPIYRDEAQIGLFAAITDAIDSPATLTDVEGRLRCVNRAYRHLTGFSAEEVEGTYFWESVPVSEEASSTRTLFNLIAARRMPARQRCQVRTREGEPRLVVWSHAPLFPGGAGPDASGQEIRSILSLGEDITLAVRAQEELGIKQYELVEANRRLRENQKQLIQSEKMASIGQLAAGVAHEINNPIGYVMSNLTTLSGYVQTLTRILRGYGELVGALVGDEAEAVPLRLDEVQRLCVEEDVDYLLEDVGPLLTQSLDGVQRVREIVQGLKSFARLDESQVKVADINEGIETTLKMVWNELKYKCEVIRDYGELPPVRCYLGQLNQVFMNLLVNAAQAIAERGEIRIQTRHEDGEVVVRVSDTGSGIAPKVLGRVFDPFYTTKEVGKGTGLGLAISHGIVEKHGGRIEVESEVGKGTTFTVRLPLDGVIEESDEILFWPASV